VHEGDHAARRFNIAALSHYHFLGFLLFAAVPDWLKSGV
jgi:hypothetical protein